MANASSASGSSPQSRRVPRRGSGARGMEAGAAARAPPASDCANGTAVSGWQMARQRTGTHPRRGRSWAARGLASSRPGHGGGGPAALPARTLACGGCGGCLGGRLGSPAHPGRGWLALGRELSGERRLCETQGRARERTRTHPCSYGTGGGGRPSLERRRGGRREADGRLVGVRVGEGRQGAGLGQRLGRRRARVSTSHARWRGRRRRAHRVHALRGGLRSASRLLPG